MRALIEFIDRIALWLYALGGLFTLLYLRALISALQDKRSTIHTMEREMATTRAYWALAAMALVFLALGGVAFVDFVLGPAVARLPRDETPQFWPFFSRPTPLAVTPTPTFEIPPRPTVVFQPTVVITPTPTSPPPTCPTPGVQITSPGSGAVLSGAVEIRGTADIANFKYYKLEFASSAQPSQWAYIGGGKEPVEEGVLLAWDTSALPPGEYLLRLVVVDKTGNYPPPCQLSITLK